MLIIDHIGLRLSQQWFSLCVEDLENLFISYVLESINLFFFKQEEDQGRRESQS